MSVKSFDWVPFYMELADQLLPYQNNRQELIEKVRQIYAITGIGMTYPIDLWILRQFGQ